MSSKKLPSMKRLLALLIVSTLALVGLSPAHAQAASNLASANAAGHWLSTQVSGGKLDDGFDSGGATADGLIGLASANDPTLQPSIDLLLASAKTDAKAYATNPGRAAKLAIVAKAYGLDPSSFGGVDLVSLMKSGVAADGSIGASPTAFTQGLVLAAFKRVGVAVPSSAGDWLAAQADASGGYGWSKGQTPDADSTALAILGLTTSSTPSTQAALTKAIAWAKANQASDGSWAGYCPVNSTAVMGSALQAAGLDQAKAISYLTGQQLTNGALPNGGTGDLMATSQGLLLLGGVSYADVTWTPKAQHPTASASSSPAPSRTTAPKATPTTSAAATTTASHTGRGVPAKTGAEDDTSPWALGICILAVAAAGGVLRGRRR